jgi:hypothetical protein
MEKEKNCTGGIKMDNKVILAISILAIILSAFSIYYSWSVHSELVQADRDNYSRTMDFVIINNNLLQGIRSCASLTDFEKFRSCIHNKINYDLG